MRLYGVLSIWRSVLFSVLGFLSLVSLGKHVVVFFSLFHELNITILVAASIMIVSYLILMVVGLTLLAGITSFVDVIFMTMVTIRLVIQ